MRKAHLIRASLAAALLTLSFAAMASAAGVRAIDGDTIEVNGETIRILNIDTPEIRHAQCDAERRLGEVAKQRVARLLRAGRIGIRRGDGGRMTDKYGRTLAVVDIDGVDIGEQLISEGLARPWTGKRRSWCN
ncbi:MAG: thermonuclease family protein [Allorhizobium sp.]